MTCTFLTSPAASRARPPVGRLGWHETLWLVGQLLAKHYRLATGTKKSALRGAANHVNFIVPGMLWCDKELQLDPKDTERSGAAT